MRLRRKGEAAAAEAAADESAHDDAADADATTEPGNAGPYDADELPDDGLARLDLGSILVAPLPDRELRVQVDEKSGEVRAVLLATDAGALELRAFAAPRGGDLWSDIRPQIAADAARRGGTATEREGRFGTELVCEVQVNRADGQSGTQTSRVIGVNGPRWLLRATFLGEPAREPEAATEWEQAITQLAVRRGAHAMPVGEQLPLNLPDGAQPKAVDAG
ncbi:MULTISPECIES: DUF3710 domain-containing protein [unclassified Nocardioides]|uniref:DUF3710 domain-containing protein n=1 Tax=unclassified Nocardioides TaxID=2615069 RepID=UPI0007035FB2|nr:MULTISPECIES: DUF3710 domain-containing protein [unclassified Nocardioides]KRC58894.1 hypothetical protein ASE19_22790 [Nocardioides sp. Root79]KRC76783.1 hypothetical protein ASE20_00550 [Nocardioides sp. Root240]